MMVQAQEEIGKGSTNPTDPHHIPTIIQPSTSQPQKKQKPRKPKRKDTEVPQPSGPTNNVADEAVYKEMDDSLERATTTATSLDADQDRGNINKTQSKATLHEPISLGTSSGSGPRRQETIGDTIAQTGKRSTVPVSAATTTTTIITNDEITLAKAHAELKKRSILLDESTCLKLQAEEEEKELAREKAQQIRSQLGRIVGIKRLLDDLGVTATKLMLLGVIITTACQELKLLEQKFTTTAARIQLLKDKEFLEDQDY
ncbi:hypothetical protein Tco_1144327 [Tanacetum coccineum]